MINFYQLLHTPYERALPILLEKTLQTGKRSYVYIADKERLLSLDRSLWTLGKGSFIPHISCYDEYEDINQHPIYFADNLDNIANFDILFNISHDYIEPDNIQKFHRYCDIFDGNDNEDLKQARIRYKSLKDAGQEIAYYQQNSDKGWDKK